MARDIKILDRHAVGTGTLIIEQGTDGGRAYIVQTGKVEVFTKNAKGEEVKITELGPGSLIGEIALLDDGVRTASVRTLEPTTLITISAHDFRTALQKSERLQDRLTQTTEQRVQEMLEVLLRESSQVPVSESGAQKEMPPLLDKLKSTLKRISSRLSER